MPSFHPLARILSRGPHSCTGFWEGQCLARREQYLNSLNEEGEGVVLGREVFVVLDAIMCPCRRPPRPLPLLAEPL